MYIGLIRLELNKLRGCSPALNTDKSPLYGATFIEYTLSQLENSNLDKALSEMKLGTKSSEMSPTGVPPKRKNGPGWPRTKFSKSITTV